MDGLGIHGEGARAVRTHPLYRYEELASFITSLVHTGTGLAGALAPSHQQATGYQPQHGAPGVPPARGPGRARGATAIWLLCRQARLRLPAATDSLRAAGASHHS